MGQITCTVILCFFTLGNLAANDNINEEICQEGWYNFQGYCYKWPSGEKLDRGLAETRCKELNSSLVTIKHADIYQFLNKTVLNDGQRSFWSTLHHCADDKFFWNDGSLLDGHMFASQEPNNYQGQENCVEILKDTTWNDIDCDKMNRVICQNMTCYESKSKDEDFKDCFYKLDELSSRWDAEKRCATNGDSLPILDQDPNDGSLFKQLLSKEEESWIGLQRGYLCWSNDTTADLINGGSKCEDDKCDCVILHGSVSWRRISCSQNLSFVCEKVAKPDLCKESEKNCDQRATCTSSYGSFTCQCHDGYNGDGKICEDIDECLEPISNDCSKNANCINTAGSFKCSCKNGYIGNGKICSEPNKFDLNTVDTNNTNEVESVIKTCTRILHQENEPETIIKVLEDFTVSVGKNLIGDQTEFVVNEEDIVLGVTRVRGRQSMKDITFPDSFEDLSPNENKIIFPSSGFTTIRNDEPTVVVGMVYDVPKELNMSKDNEWFVNSKIVNGIISPEPNIIVEDPIRIQFRILKHKENTQMRCAFLEFHQSGGSSWSFKGCDLVMSNRSHAKCECNHLTNFAILMKVNSDKIPDEHNKALSIITYIGLSASIIGCLLTLIVYIYFKKLRTGRGFIHINLVISLVFADIVFMLAILTDHNDESCLAMAILVFYFFLSLFFWMLVEGLYIYLMVSKVFDVMGKISKLSYSVVGWGFSAIIVGLTYGILRSEFLSEEYCWLSTKSGAIWAFVGPISFIILINVIIMMIVLKLTMTTLPDNPYTSRTRSAFRIFVMLTPILGITWLFGILTITRSSNIFQYIFAILNSFQGLVIFFLYCVVNKEARKEIERKYRNYCLSRSLSVSEKKLSSSEKALGKISRTPSKNSLTGSTKKVTETTSVVPRYSSWPELAYQAADPFPDGDHLSSLSRKNVEIFEYPPRQQVDATGKLFEVPSVTAGMNINHGQTNDNEKPEPEIYPLKLAV